MTLSEIIKSNEKEFERGWDNKNIEQDYPTVNAILKSQLKSHIRSSNIAVIEGIIEAIDDIIDNMPPMNYQGDNYDSGKIQALSDFQNYLTGELNKLKE